MQAIRVSCADHRLREELIGRRIDAMNNNNNNISTNKNEKIAVIRIKGRHHSSMHACVSSEA